MGKYYENLMEYIYYMKFIAVTKTKKNIKNDEIIRY